MPSVRFKQFVFWGIVGLFLALALCWLVVPGVYFHNHPVTPWPGADYGSPIWPTHLFWTAVFAALGFLQLRLVRRHESVPARFLFWLYLGLGALWLIDGWIFALSVQFWISQGKHWSHLREIGYRTSTQFGLFLVRGTLLIGVSNLVFSLLRSRRIR